MATMAAALGSKKEVPAPVPAAPAVVEVPISTEGIDPELLKSKPLTEVQLDAHVVLKIIKHCRDHYPDIASGQLLGIDANGTLEVTNCYPLTVKSSDDDEADDSVDVAEYQLQMLRSLRKLNYDANTVGWYRSTYLGSFWNQSLIETQYNYQKTVSQSVVILYDPTRTTQGNLCLRAMRLSNTFMELYASKKFTMESLIEKKVTPSSIFQTLPIKVRNSHLLNALLYQLEESTAYSPSILNSLRAPSSTFTSSLSTNISPLSPNFDNLELGLESYLEKHLEHLGDTVEEHIQEQWRWQGWQRNLQKEQTKVQQTVSKKRAENVTRAAQGQPALHSEEDLQATSALLQKLLASEPSRLETLIITNQIDTYAKQINQFAGPSLTKMYMIKGLQSGK